MSKLSARFRDNDPVLTRIFRGYKPVDQDFIADLILPKIRVRTKTGQIPQVRSTAQDFLRIQNNLVISDAGHPEITADFEKASAWTTVARGAQMRITKDMGLFWADNSQNWKTGMTFARRSYTMLLKTFRNMSRDFALASQLFNTSVITNNVTLSGSAQFNDPNSNPLSVFRTARMTIEANAHVDPEELDAIIPYPIFEYLRDHPQLKETTANGGTVQVDSLTKKQLAKALHVRQVIVPRVSRETANIGQASSLSRIWGNYILLFHVNRNPQPEVWQRSLGFNFVMDDVMMDWYELKQFKDTQFIRYTEEDDQLLLDTGAAYLIASPIDSTLFT